MQLNYTFENTNNWKTIYNAPYSDNTRVFLENLNRDDCGEWMLVGAKYQDEEQFRVCAFGRTDKVLAKTTSTSKIDF